MSLTPPRISGFLCPKKATAHFLVNPNVPFLQEETAKEIAAFEGKQLNK